MTRNVEERIKLCALELFERGMLSKSADPDPVKEVLRKYFGKRKRGGGDGK